MGFLEILLITFLLIAVLLLGACLYMCVEQRRKSNLQDKALKRLHHALEEYGERITAINQRISHMRTEIYKSRRELQKHVAGDDEHNHVNTETFK